MLNACLKDGTCKTIFSQEQTNSSCWGAKLFSVFYSTHEMEVNFSGIYKKETSPEDTREQSYLHMFVFTFRCNGGLWYKKARYRPGEHRLLRTGWKDPQKKASQPMGIPWLSPTSEQPHFCFIAEGTIPLCACVHIFNVALRDKTLRVQRQDLLREYPTLPQKGH